MSEWDDGKHEQLLADVNALEKEGYDTSDVGRGNKAVTPKTVAKETGSTSPQAAAAGHAARDDIAADGTMGIPANRHG